MFADSNLDKAAVSAAIAVFYNGVQTCTAGTRLIVENSIREKFVEMVVEKSRGWMPGNPIDPATTMGPMIDDAQLKIVADYVGIGQEEGASLVFGGDITEPFGGFKQSGNGRDKSMHAIDDYTEQKTTWIEFD